MGGGDLGPLKTVKCLTKPPIKRFSDLLGFAPWSDSYTVPTNNQKRGADL